MRILFEIEKSNSLRMHYALFLTILSNQGRLREKWPRRKSSSEKVWKQRKYSRLCHCNWFCSLDFFWFFFIFGFFWIFFFGENLVLRKCENRGNTADCATSSPSLIVLLLANRQTGRDYIEVSQRRERKCISHKTRLGKVKDAFFSRKEEYMKTRCKYPVLLSLGGYLCSSSFGKPSFSKSKALIDDGEETVFSEACMPIYNDHIQEEA